MVRLINKAHTTPYPADWSIRPKAMPMARYPISTGTVTGKAAAKVFRSISLTPHCKQFASTFYSFFLRCATPTLFPSQFSALELRKVKFLSTYLDFSLQLSIIMSTGMDFYLYYPKEELS